VGMGSVPSEWQGAVSAIAFGLAIGILEELANFAVLRFWLRDVRSWAHGLMLGLGHGGAESAFSGIVGFIWYMTMSSLRAGPPAGEDISEAERAGLDQLVASFWSTSWPTPILAGLQQALLIVLSLGLATLVMRVFLTGKIIYLPTAMALHSLAAGSLVFAGQYGLPASLAASAMFAAIGLVIVRRFAEPPPALQPAAVRPAQAADAGAEPRPTRAARPRKKRAKKTS